MYLINLNYTYNYNYFRQNTLNSGLVLTLALVSYLLF